MTIVSDSDVTHAETSSDSTRGTVRWMSPELLYPGLFGLKNGNPTKASDVYALGMVILQVRFKHPTSFTKKKLIFNKVLTGKVPFHKSNATAVTYQVLNDVRPVRPENSIGIGLLDSVWEVVESCWNRDALQRPEAKHVWNVIKTASSSWNASFVTSADASDAESKLSNDSTVDNESSSYVSETSVTRSRDATQPTSITNDPSKTNRTESPLNLFNTTPGSSLQNTPVYPSSDSTNKTPASSYYSLPSSKSSPPTASTAEKPVFELHP